MTKTLEKTKTCLNLIGGEWVKSNTGKTFTSYSPANQEEVIGSFADSDETDVKKAVDAAAKAFETWRKVPAPERAEIILRAGLLLEQHKESLAKDMTREMGKVLNEARGDVQEAIIRASFD